MLGRPGNVDVVLDELLPLLSTFIHDDGPLARDADAGGARAEQAVLAHFAALAGATPAEAGGWCATAGAAAAEGRREPGEGDTASGLAEMRECDAIGEELPEKVAGAEQLEAEVAADPVTCAEVAPLAEAAAACGLETASDAGPAGARGETIELLVWALGKKIWPGTKSGPSRITTGSGPCRTGNRTVERPRDAMPQWLAQEAARLIPNAVCQAVRAAGGVDS